MPDEHHAPPADDIGLPDAQNGHRVQARETLLEHFAQRGTTLQFAHELIQLLRTDAYTSVLYQPAYQRRCAQIKQTDRPFYMGTLYEAVKIARGPQQALAWDREIDVWVYSQDRLVTVPLSSIPDEDIHWLWEPYVPLSKLTLVEGDPEAGKTYLLLALAAAVTRGFHLPDQQGTVARAHGTCGTVLYLTAEDGLGDTIKKRARLCDADLDRIFVVPSSSLFPEDMQPFSLARPHLLSAAIEERQTSLVILDPLTAFLGAEVDMHRANEVRPLLSVLGAMAAKHACAIVAIRHWTKAVGGKAAYRGQGNIDFRAAARSVLAVGESPEDERHRIMAHSKTSTTARGVSMVFEISDIGLRWAGTSLMTADELSAAQPRRHHEQRKDAMHWLKDYLRDGPKSAEVALELAAAVHISERTLRRAKEALHVLSVKDKGLWLWRLPTFQKWERYPGYEEDDD